MRRSVTVPAFDPSFCELASGGSIAAFTEQDFRNNSEILQAAMLSEHAIMRRDHTALVVVCDECSKVTRLA
jgi:hypothetical protein